MATQAINVTYDNGQTVQRSYGLVVTLAGKVFVNVPTTDRRNLLQDLDLLRAEVLRQMNNGTIADTNSKPVEGLGMA